MNKYLSETLLAIGRATYHGHRVIKSVQVPKVRDKFKDMGQRIQTGYAIAMVKDKNSEFNQEIRKELNEVKENGIQMEMDI